MIAAPEQPAELDPMACRRLLLSADFGRLAVRSDDGVDIFPVNFLLHGDALYFRSGPGSKMVDLTRDPRVAFEVDGRIDGAVWSVVVHGRAVRLSVDVDIESSTVLALRAWDPSAKFNYVRIAIATISGRRVPIPSESDGPR